MALTSVDWILVCLKSCYSWQLFKAKLTLMGVNFHEHYYFHFNTPQHKLALIIWQRVMEKFSFCLSEIHRNEVWAFWRNLLLFINQEFKSENQL